MFRRSREGAWIEIGAMNLNTTGIWVAPVRERGLKCFLKNGTWTPDEVAPVRERGLKYYIYI